MTRAWGIAAVLGLFAAACDAELVYPGSGVAPRVEALSMVVDPGAPVALRLSNPTRQEFTYHLCSAARLQRLQGGVWVGTPSLLTVCTMDQPHLAPGAEVHASYWIPEGTPRGTHRLAVEFGARGERVLVESNPFTVR